MSGSNRKDGKGGRTAGNSGKCSVCNKSGHNKLSCPQGIVIQDEGVIGTQLLTGGGGGGNIQRYFRQPVAGVHNNVACVGI